MQAVPALPYGHLSLGPGHAGRLLRPAVLLKSNLWSLWADEGSTLQPLLPRLNTKP